MARPTKYKKKFCKMADDYILSCVDTEKKFHKTRSAHSNSYERIIEVKLPTIEGFSVFLDVCVKTLMNWAGDHKEFLQALNRIKLAQKEKLIAKGMSGEYNPTIAKLVLSANHGMHEKTESEVKVKALTADSETVKQANNLLDDFIG